MKKIFTISLILGIKFVFGQGTVNFVNANATWTVAKTFPAGTQQFPNFVATTTNTYGYLGDTLIGSVLWTKMFFTPDSNFSTSSNLTKAGYLQSSNDLVFFMDTLFNLDTIYNFNLQVGDSVQYDFGLDSTYLFVSNIDSIVINGSYHKRFSFTEPPGFGFYYLKELWIEGIGSIHGPLFTTSPTLFSSEMPDSMYLTCYKTNNSIIWNNPYYSNCYNNIVLSVSGLDEIDDRILIFPNPVGDVSVMELTDSFISIEIYNIQGRKIRSEDIKGKTQIFLNKTDFQQGNFIYKLTTLKGSYQTGKFIVK